MILTRQSDLDTPSQQLLITRAPIVAKFSIKIDCDELLKPCGDSHGISAPKTADESVQHVYLEVLSCIRIVYKIKTACIHTCEMLEEKDYVCLSAL